MTRTPLFLMSMAALTVGAGCERSKSAPPAEQELAVTELNRAKVEPSFRPPSQRTGRNLEERAYVQGLSRTTPGEVMRAEVDPAALPRPLTTVSLKGSLEAQGFEAKTLVAYLSASPCGAEGETGTPTGQTSVSFAKRQPFTLAAQQAMGSVLHVCALALGDQRQVVAQGGWENNPVQLHHSGQAMEVNDVTVTLQRLKAPRALPEGWLR